MLLPPPPPPPLLLLPLLPAATHVHHHRPVQRHRNCKAVHHVVQLTSKAAAFA
jgi:hypothetical protein